MMGSRGAKVSILRRQMVKPAGVQAHEGALYMTAWDEVFGVQHNQTVLLYRSGPPMGMEVLASSLGMALAQFSPLAGRLRWAEGERRRRLEIMCNGEGAELVEAECDGEMSWFRDPDGLDRVALLLPAVDYERPMEEVPACMVQLTRFRCGGLALAVSTFHMAADGESAFHFISEWARCLCKARALAYEQQTILSFPVNVRSHIHTIPLPRATFGNMAIMMRAQTRVREIISNDLGFVCEKVREAINLVDEDYIWSNFDLLEEQDDLSLFMKDISVESKMPTKGKPYYGNPNVKVVSWLSLPIHGIDFGWGNYIDIIPVARDVDGSTILLPMPGENDGSIVVVLCLQLAHVEEFKKHFYDGIHE